jgi:hypothetical protein
MATTGMVDIAGVVPGEYSSANSSHGPEGILHLDGRAYIGFGAEQKLLIGELNTVTVQPTYPSRAERFGERMSILPDLRLSSPSSFNPSFSMLGREEHANTIVTALFAVQPRYADGTSELFFMDADGGISSSPVTYKRTVIRSKIDFETTRRLKDIVTRSDARGYEIYGGYTTSTGALYLSGYRVSAPDSDAESDNRLNQERAYINNYVQTIRDTSVEWSDLWPFIDHAIKLAPTQDAELIWLGGFKALLKDKGKTIVCQEVGNLVADLGVINGDEGAFVSSACQLFSDAKNPLVSAREKEAALASAEQLFLKTRLGEQSRGYCNSLLYNDDYCTGYGAVTGSFFAYAFNSAIGYIDRGNRTLLKIIYGD